MVAVCVFQAMSYLLERSIVVWQPQPAAKLPGNQGSGLFVAAVFGEELMDSLSARPLHVVYNGVNHYDSLHLDTI